MNHRPNVTLSCMLKTLWPALALLASSILLAQEQDPVTEPLPQAGETVSETAQAEDVQAEDAQAGTAQSETPATEPEVPVQSLTGPLDLLVNPVYPPETARRVYQPLVDYLNEATGLEINLVVDRNFHRYWLNARRNEAPPLILEDAHIVAWRMINFDYQPLVAASKPITFSLLTTATGDLADAALMDFVGRRISSLPSPSLGYLVLADWYDNPMQQPLIESTATSWMDAVEMVFSGEVDAAIAPDNIAARYPNLSSVDTSPEFPGLTLSAAPDVPDDVRQRLIDAMTALHSDEEHHAALFELDIDEFVDAVPADYEGMEQWLSTVFAL
ncbi:MAG: PhnD/SsuA/transferrin family substrate-binding protein [Wenzhouxiangellaceae bacterium]